MSNTDPESLAGRPTVLIVDDVVSNIDLLRATLSDSYRIKAATSGRRALDIVFANPPDLILLDIMMPELDGYAVCRRLKADPDTAKIPVIFVTATGEAHNEELGFSLGAADYIVKPFEPSVVRARVSTHLSLYDQTRLLEGLVTERTAQLRAEMDQREQAVERIRYLHDYDGLTGLPNRRLLLQRIDLALEQADAQVAVVVLDIDRFTAINDALGARLGDNLLRQVANALQASLPGSNAIGRLGGDTFGALIRSDSAVIDRLHTAAEAIERMLSHASRTYDIEGERLQVSLSGGVALHPQDGGDADTLIKGADAAMHAAKQSPATPYVFYNADMNAASRSLLQLEGELGDAIERGRIEPWYQPKLRVSDRQVVGAEALARWQRPDGRRISPGVFIPLAERTGLIKPLNEMLIHAVCRQARAWAEDSAAHNRAPLRLAANLSPVDFQYPGFVEDLKAVVRDTGVNPSLIELEITEGAVMQDPLGAAETIEALAALEFSIAIDDFGSGHSSLAAIRQYQIHTLKIDQSFMTDVGHDHDADAVAATILTLANRLRLHSVGEGVENEAQMSFLANNGCQTVQGFLFSAAVPPDDFATQFLTPPSGDD